MHSLKIVFVQKCSLDHYNLDFKIKNGGEISSHVQFKSISYTSEYFHAE